jgi:hypothetical protein
MRIPLVLVSLMAACGGSSPAPVESPAPAGEGEPDGQPPPGAPADPPPAGENAPTWTDTSACSQRPDQFGPVTLTASQATGRYGHGSTRFDQVLSSKERAVEVCGPSGELDWLFSTSCSDGSHPFADRATAHAARRGSVGGGGRCGSVIDHYAVPCPEQTYDVYMDMYMCGPGESM